MHHCHYRFNSYYIIGHFVICILKCSLPFVLLTAWQCRRLTSYRENINIEKIFVCERAARASLENFCVCTFQKSSFFHYFCWYLGYFVGIITLLLVTFVTSVHSMQFPFYYSRHGTRNALQATGKTRKSVCERVERASLEKFRILYVPKVLFLSLFLLVLRIFCRYNYIFVG